MDKCLVDKKIKINYAVPLDGDWELEGIVHDDEALCLNATIFGNSAQFFNHRCEDANLLDILIGLGKKTHVTTMYVGLPLFKNIYLFFQIHLLTNSHLI